MRNWDIPEPPVSPPEEESLGYCAACGDEIYSGDTIYETPDGYIHAECLEEYLQEHVSIEQIAECLGYEKLCANREDMCHSCSPEWYEDLL